MITRSPRLYAAVLFSLAIGGLACHPAPAAPKKLAKNNVLPPMPIPDPLLQGWNNTPVSTKPFVYWYWLNNIVTKHGITKDLEHMKKVGIGGAYIGNIGGPDINGTRNGYVKGYSKEWYDLMAFAITEGERLGVQVGTFNGSGWSQSGGPWVKPEDSMQFLEFAEVKVEGGTRIDQILPRVKDAVVEVRTIAFPAPAHDGEVLRAAKLTSPQGAELGQLIDGESHELPANKDFGNLNLTWEFDAPTTVRSILFHHHNGNKRGGRVLYSTDGTNFQPLRDFTLDRRDGPQVLLGKRPGAVSVAPTTARFFRVEMPWDTRRDGRDLGITLSSAARLESAEEKQMGIASRDNTPAWDHYRWAKTPEPGEGEISPAQVIDLTSKVNAEGRLTWDAPAGNWVVQRYSTVSTGAKSSPAPSDLTGLEIDKMSKGAAKRHIDNGQVGELYRHLKPEERKGFKWAIADSYEVGFQNWTPDMIAEFKTRHGYDPVPWLPVMSGRVVGSAAQSDRFLWDVRRMVADLVAEYYVGGLRDAMHGMGLKLWLEPYGHWGFPGEFGMYGGQADAIGGEYWNPQGLGGVELRVATSVGHMYGKNIISSESFTSGGNPRGESPGYLKAKSDWAVANGVNHYVLHVVSHQPSDVVGPGFILEWGTYFDRNSLWYTEHGKAWTDGVRRTCFLMQQGVPAAQIAYYVGEDTPVMTGKADPETPAGYDFDWVNAEVLLKRATVKNGRLTLQGGASYAVLAIPNTASMRPAVLNKINELVKQGLIVVGSAPTQSPSLEGYPAADAKIKSVVAQLWPASGDKSRQVGKGKVWNSTALAPILTGLKVGPAITGLNENVLWKQRHLEDGKIFFIANQNESTVQMAPSFNASGLVPQLFNGETGSIESPGAYREANGRTTVPITLGPLDHIMVVFRKPKTKPVAATDVKFAGNSVINWGGAKSASPGEIADSNLNESVWVKPSGTIELPQQRGGGGAVALANQRWALFPPQGTTARGDGFAGSGISVGTNGVVVVQHWPFNAPAVLVWKSPTPLTDWTHVLVSYRAGVPHLLINGKDVATGLRTGQRVIAGQAGEDGQVVQGSPYEGNVRGRKTSYTAISDAEIAALIADKTNTAPAMPAVATLVRDVKGTLQLHANRAGTYSVNLAGGTAKSVTVPAPLDGLTISNPWTVVFQGAAAPKAQKFDKLINLSESTDELTKYFSGNVIYDTTFELPATFKPGSAACTLNLGRVETLARVAVNGKAAGTALRSPFHLEIGSLLQPGKNTLRVLVTNTWANRAIGDEQFPEDVPRDWIIAKEWPKWALNGTPRPEPRRVTIASRNFFGKDNPLPASGLMGPVKLNFESVVGVK